MLEILIIKMEFCKTDISEMTLQMSFKAGLKKPAFCLQKTSENRYIWAKKTILIFPLTNQYFYDSLVKLHEGEET